MSKKQKQSHKLHAAGEYHTTLKSPNIKHGVSLTKQWREMDSALGDIGMLSKLDNDISSISTKYMQPIFLSFPNRCYFRRNP